MGNKKRKQYLTFSKEAIKALDSFGCKDTNSMHTLKDECAQTDMIIKLLEDTCQGLKTRGWNEHGGSSVWRYLSKGETSIKVYLNDYTTPTHIVTRYS